MPEGALADLTVVEWGQFIAAPYAGKLLADLGATVIKVEPPQGDEARRHGPFPEDLPHPEKSGLYLFLNTNKQSVTLNVDTATGLALLKRLIAQADVFVCGATPRRIEKLGLDYASLSVEQPELVATYITPFGLTGSDRDYVTTDMVSVHLSGYAREAVPATDDPAANPPQRPGGRQADFVAGLAAATGTLTAVEGRRGTGRGDCVDVSEVEALTTFVYPKMVALSYENKRPSRLKVDAPVAGAVWVLPCTDGWVAISPREEHQWVRWLEVMGNPAWAEDPKFKDRVARTQNKAELDEHLAAWTRQHSKAEITREAQALRVAAFPMNTAEDLLNSAQYAEREFFVDVEHPVAGTFKYPAAPYRFSETPWKVRHPAPTLGEHNDPVLCGRLRLTRQDLVELRGTGII